MSKIFIVSQDKLTSVQKASVKKPHAFDVWEAMVPGKRIMHFTDMANAWFHGYEDHLASLLTAHNSPELQAIVKGGGELRVGIDVEIKTTWVRNTERSYPTKDDFDYLLTPIEVEEQGEDAVNHLYRQLRLDDILPAMDAVNKRLLCERIEHYKKQSTPPAQTVLDAAKEYADTGWKYVEDEDGKDKTVIDEKIYNAFIAGASMNGSGGMKGWKEVIRERAEYFDSKFHSHEAKKLVGALYAIEQLVPPHLFLQQSPAELDQSKLWASVEEAVKLYPLNFVEMLSEQIMLIKK